MIPPIQFGKVVTVKNLEEARNKRRQLNNQQTATEFLSVDNHYLLLSNENGTEDFKLWHEVTENASPKNSSVNCYPIGLLPRLDTASSGLYFQPYFVNQQNYKKALQLALKAEGLKLSEQRFLQSTMDSLDHKSLDLAPKRVLRSIIETLRDLQRRFWG